LFFFFASLCLSAFCHTGGRHWLALCLQWQALCLLQISGSRFSIIIGPDLLGLYRCGGGCKLTILANYNLRQRQLPGINTVSDAALQCYGPMKGISPPINNFGYKLIFSRANMFLLCSSGRLTIKLTLADTF